MRSISWDQHLDRDMKQQEKVWREHADACTVNSKFSWAPILRAFHDSSWLRDRRTISFDFKGRKSSRTNTRAGRGKVHMRWEDSIEYAGRMML